MKITHASASKNILRHCDKQRLVQKAWHSKTKDGRRTACLLGSIHSSVNSPRQCNGDLMPLWLAEVTPPLFDGIDPMNMYSFARRYGALVARWHVLDEARWNDIRDRFLIFCIDAALDAVRPINEDKDYWPAVVSACEQVKEAIKTGIGLKEAANAAYAAANAAYAAANAAANAADAAAAYAAANAADAAAYAAADAARSANAARSAAYEKMFTFLLDLIEEGLHAYAARL